MGFARRLYTTASRSRCRRGMVCGPLIVCASSSGDRRHEHIGHGGHQIRAGSASHHSRKLPSSEELEIDRRDLRQRGVEATGRLHAPRHRFDRIRRDVQQAAAFARAHRHIDVGAVQLPLGAAAPGLAAPAHLAVQGPAQRRFHIRHGAREAGATRLQLSHAQGAQSGLVFHSDTRLVPSSRPVKRGPSAATTTARSRSTSTVRGLAAGAAPRSVKCSGRVTVFNEPASQTYTRPRVGSRYVRSNRIEIRWPASGWYGCVTTSESKRSLYGDAVCSDRRNTERSLPPVLLRDVHPSNRLRSVRPPLQPLGEGAEVVLHCLSVVPPRLTIHARSGFLLQRGIGRPQSLQVIDVVQERREPQLPVPSCRLTYPLQRTERAVPARCPGRVLLGQVSFGQTASLHLLRDRLPGVVRRLHWYCRSVRLPLVVHRRRASKDFPTRSAATVPAGDQGTSRFSCEALPYVHGVSDRAGSRRVSRYRRAEWSLPLLLTASAPRRKCLSRLNTRPARIPVNASTRSSRAAPHDSGSVWLATPSPYDSFIHYTSPV